jgi:VanZ family protein
MSASSGRPASGLDFKFALWTFLYLAGIYALSSIPEPPAREAHAWLMLISNVAHAPVFAGLALLVLKTLSGPNGIPNRYVMAFAVTALVSALDEWHQAFVPGRTVSAADLALDLAGSACALLIVRARQATLGSRCEAE